MGMSFIGQDAIMNQLKYILPHLYENDVGMNLLLRGPSGWGKTKMSLSICNYLTGGDFVYCLGDNVKFNPAKRVHFIDEIHMLKEPEILYPRMDAGTHVFVLATNDVAVLAEALSNRCENFIFDKYTIPQLRAICETYLTSSLPESFLDYIIESAGSNPRVIKSLSGRLNLIESRTPGILKGIGLEEFKYLLQKTFGIVDGMDIMCQRYIEALTKLGGTASLSTISAYVHTDEGTLKFYVEPVLLYKNRIKISSKGRSLI